jgi:hypothetical protein
MGSRRNGANTSAPRGGEAGVRLVSFTKKSLSRIRTALHRFTRTLAVAVEDRFAESVTVTVTV